MRLHLFSILAAVGGFASACASTDESASEELLGEASVALTQTPADVSCVRITVSNSTRKDVRLFDVDKGVSANLHLPNLPLGSVTFVGDAFSAACASVDANSAPNWLSDPVVVTLVTNRRAPVALNFHRASGGDVSLNFDDDAGFNGADVLFTIDATRNVHSISPFIYGTNGLSDKFKRTTAVRIGGTRWSTYNWENNASNAGSDYLNQNDAALGGGTTPGEAVRKPVADAMAAGASALVTIPMLGYVAADTGPGGDVNATPNYLTTRFRKTQSTKGSAFVYPPNLTDAVVYQDEFISWLEGKFPTARTDAKKTIFYALDNEPELWSAAHPRIHPSATTYAELVQKTKDYAAMVKRVAPGAQVFGPVNYGWAGFVNLNGATDAGGGDFLEFYLDEMKKAEAAAGKRVVDVMDVHWYPEVTGVTGTATDDSTAKARVQAPRSLWDDTYLETSWITTSTTGFNKSIRLVPRLKDKIAVHYPGTKVAISEYSYGAGNHISGGVAEADALGVFGREDVYMAAVWPLGDNGDPYVYGALSLYRNFDGLGGSFGDTSVYARTSDDNQTSVYASIDSTGTTPRMVIVALNKNATPVKADVEVTQNVTYNTVEVYSLTSAGPTPVRGTNVAITRPNSVTLTLPAMSATTFVLKP